MITILTIEDDPAILRGLSDNLQFEGYEVITAADGETGYRLQRERKPDLIVLDLMLPRMSGFELCRKLRGEGIQTPILMLTARSEELDRILGLDLGADDYVTKPFSVRELMARIRALHPPQPAAQRPGGRPAVWRRRNRLSQLRGAPQRRAGRDDAQGIRDSALPGVASG